MLVEHVIVGRMLALALRDCRKTMFDVFIHGENVERPRGNEVQLLLLFFELLGLHILLLEPNIALGRLKHRHIASDEAGHALLRRFSFWCEVVELSEAPSHSVALVEGAKLLGGQIF